MCAVEVTYRFDWSAAQQIDTPLLLLQGEVTLPIMRASTAALDAVLPNSRVVATTATAIDLREAALDSGLLTLKTEHTR